MLKIAQVSPLYESVPPQKYGGTERVVSWLTEELVRSGHQVTLFASGDSQTSAELIAPCPKALRLADCVDSFAHHMLMLEMVAQQADRFDVIHYHCDYLHFPLSRRLHAPHVTTLHGRLDLPDLPPLYKEFSEMPVVSISDSQRKPLAWANWQGTVYHGFPLDQHSYQAESGDYLAFLGRICPEKGVERAVEIAIRTGRVLRIAAKVDNADKVYYRDCIEPLLKKAGSAVEFIGEVGGKEKDEFLGRAAAVLFPINWPEPFGLVMIEAMACGTPMIAWRNGSVPEVLENGVTGFIVESVDEAVEAVEQLHRLDRATCRLEYEKRFCVSRMVKDYLHIYNKVIAAHNTLEDDITPVLRMDRPVRNGSTLLGPMRMPNVEGEGLTFKADVEAVREEQDS